MATQIVMPKKTYRMAKTMAVPDEVIINKIYFIRGKKVMLDRDLAELYNVTTGNLNKAVKRNLKRFPDDFMFQLSEEEFRDSIFQNGTSSWGGMNWRVKWCQSKAFHRTTEESGSSKCRDSEI